MQKLPDGTHSKHTGSGRNNRCSLLAAATLIICLLIIYWPGFAGDWYLDDFGNIHENPNVHLKSLSMSEISKSFYGMDRSHNRFNRPIAYFSLALNYYFGGTDPFGYHVVNFSVHCGTALFLFLLILNILKLPLLKDTYGKKAGVIALLSALLWATHPIQVNAVTYIVQRMAALAGLFTVLSFYCYLKGRTVTESYQGGFSRFGWYAGCALTGACAVFSKQNAAMLPVSLLLFDLLLIRGTATVPRQMRRAVKIGGAFLVIFLFLFVLLGGPEAFNADYAGRPFTLLERLLTQPRVIFFYIGQLLYPAGATFALLHDIPVSVSLLSPWTTLPAIGLLLLAAGGSLMVSRKWPLFAFSYLFFFLNHFIEGSFLPLELIFEHRNYLPSLFFFLLPSIGFFKFIRYFSYSPFFKVLGFFAAGVWVASQAHTTFTQNSLFRNPIAFWHTNVSLYPDLHRPRHNLARVLFISGLDDEAEKQMYRSLDGKSSAKIGQKYITAYNLGVYYLYRYKYRQALEQFAVILNANPQHVRTLRKTAELYLETGNGDKALQLIDRALSHNRKTPSLHVLRGFILLSLGQIEAAFEAADRAEFLNPGQPGAHYIRGEGYRLKGELDASLTHFETIYNSGYRTYATLLALVELYYLTGNSSRLDQTLEELNRSVGGNNKNAVLSAFDRRWNRVGKTRMENLAAAMKR